MHIITNTSDIMQVCNIVDMLTGTGETSKAIFSNVVLHVGKNLVTTEELEKIKLNPVMEKKFSPAGGCLQCDEMPKKISERDIINFLADAEQPALLEFLLQKTTDTRTQELIRAKLPAKNAEEEEFAPYHSKGSRL